MNTKKLQDLRCVNGFTLKMIAIITMTIDHTAAVMIAFGLPYVLYYPMRAIGRIAFPIYCFLLVEGYFHTHSVGRYLRRLLIAAVASDIPFDLAFSMYWPDWYSQNVMLTLAIGLAAVYLIDHSMDYAGRVTQDETLRRVLRGALVVVFTYIGYRLGVFLCTDYDGGGVLLILVFYFFRKRPAALCAGVLAVLYGAFGAVELPGMIAMAPILLYNGQRGPTPGGKAGQYFFYAYYPLHLLLLVLLSILLSGDPGLYTFFPTA